MFNPKLKPVPTLSSKLFYYIRQKYPEDINNIKSILLKLHVLEISYSYMIPGIGTMAVLGHMCYTYEDDENLVAKLIPLLANHNDPILHNFILELAAFEAVIDWKAVAYSLLGKADFVYDFISRSDYLALLNMAKPILPMEEKL